MSAYLSRSVLDALGQVQAELYEHLFVDAGGRCTGCGELEPCRRRYELHQALLRYGCLPRRVPGITKAGLRRKVVS
jgi:hypothetical protein